VQGQQPHQAGFDSHAMQPGHVGLDLQRFKDSIPGDQVRDVPTVSTMQYVEKHGWRLALAGSGGFKLLLDAVDARPDDRQIESQHARRQADG